MGMNIKNQEAHELALAIAREEGKTVTQVVLDALRDRREQSLLAKRRRELERALEEFRGCLKDAAGDGTILTDDDLYDPETGLPR